MSGETDIGWDARLNGLDEVRRIGMRPAVSDTLTAQGYPPVP
jgi:hypothetical protein